MGPLIASYIPKLPVDSQAARKMLTKCLSNGGTMDALRNRYSFHSPTIAMLDKTFAMMPEEEDWSWYLTDEHSSTLMLSCETVLGYGVAGEGKGADVNDGFGSILSEVIGIANAMNEFMTGLAAVLHGMKADRVKLQAPKHVYRVSGLGRDPVVHARRGCLDAGHDVIDDLDGPDRYAYVFYRPHFC